MKSLFKTIRLLSLIILIFSLFYACSGTFEDTDGLTVFRYNEASGITSLDPVYSRNQANIWATSQVFNSLLQLDENLNIVPSIAREWSISDDGLIYTFFLRDDVYFHDSPVFSDGMGRKATAADFVFSFSRLINPSLSSPGSWVMNPVARNIDGSLAVKALSDTVLEIRLSEPFPPMTGLLCMQYCSVVPHEALQKYGSDFRRNPVGTGPFQFKYWKEGVKLVLVKNPLYFEFDGEKRLPYLDAVSVSFIIDRQTAFLEFIKGNLDFLSGVESGYKDELLTPDGQLQEKYHESFYKLTGPFLNTEYLGILMETDGSVDLSVLQKKQVRQAINYGFDRVKMLLYLRNNIGTPAHAGFVPVGMPGFPDNIGGYHYDQDRARRLLAEAGFPQGEGLPTIALSTTAQYVDIAQYIQHELSLIGIRVTIDAIPPATLREMLSKGDAPFFRHSWIADYPDAENYLALFYSPNRAPQGPNYTRFSNSEFDRLYERSVSIVDDSLRFEYYNRMNNIIISEAPAVVLFYDQFIRFMPHYVKNMTSNPLNHLILKTVMIER
jgi:oligopeptide transport system substrate-binding protein